MIFQHALKLKNGIYSGEYQMQLVLPPKDPRN